MRYCQIATIAVTTPIFWPELSSVSPCSICASKNAAVAGRIDQMARLAVPAGLRQPFAHGHRRSPGRWPRRSRFPPAIRRTIGCPRSCRNAPPRRRTRPRRRRDRRSQDPRRSRAPPPAHRRSRARHRASRHGSGFPDASPTAPFLPLARLRPRMLATPSISASSPASRSRSANHSRAAIS